MIRDTSHNPGFLSLAAVPEDKYVVGVVVVLMDDDGDYSTMFLPEAMDAVPAPEVQENVGPWVAQSFEIANLTHGSTS